MYKRQHQTITVPANSSNDYQMKNDEWSVKVSIDKIDKMCIRDRFYRQAKALNGTIIRIVPGSPDCINVMEIRKIDHTSSELLDGPMPEQSELAAKIQKLHIFFSLLIPDLSNEERQLLDEAIVTTYRNKGITYDNASLDDPARPGQYREMPILGDLHAVCLLYTSRCV